MSINNLWWVPDMSKITLGEFNHLYGPSYELRVFLNRNDDPVLGLFANEFNPRPSRAGAWTQGQLSDTPLVKPYDGIVVPQHVIDRVTKGRIVIYKEHHGTHYYAAHTQEQLFEAALAIFDLEFEHGCFYEPEAPKDPGVRGPDIEKIPERLQEHASKILSDYIEAKQRYERELAEYRQALKAKEERDPRLAWYCLREGYDEGCVRIEYLM